MDAREILKCEFDAEEGSFLLQLRIGGWDGDAFRRLTRAMYEVADEIRGQPSIETWIAWGFWFCESTVQDWARTSKWNGEASRDAELLIFELCYFLFRGESPYGDDTLRRKAMG